LIFSSAFKIPAPSAGDVKIQMAIPVGIKKQNTHVIIIRMLLYHRGRKATIGLLSVQGPRISRTPSDIKIFQPVAVDVSHGKTWPIFALLMGNQPLGFEVNVFTGLM